MTSRPITPTAIPKAVAILPLAPNIRSRMAPNITRNNMPVSYTHLDVYKRQLLREGNLEEALRYEDALGKQYDALRDIVVEFCS